MCMTQQKKGKIWLYWRQFKVQMTTNVSHTPQKMQQFNMSVCYQLSSLMKHVCIWCTLQIISIFCLAHNLHIQFSSADVLIQMFLPSQTGDTQTVMATTKTVWSLLTLQCFASWKLKIRLLGSSRETHHETLWICDFCGTVRCRWRALGTVNRKANSLRVDSIPELGPCNCWKSVCNNIFSLSCRNRVCTVVWFSSQVQKRFQIPGIKPS